MSESPFGSLSSIRSSSSSMPISMSRSPSSSRNNSSESSPLNILSQNAIYHYPISVIPSSPANAAMSPASESLLSPNTHSYSGIDFIHSRMLSMTSSFSFLDRLIPLFLKYSRISSSTSGQTSPSSTSKPSSTLTIFLAMFLHSLSDTEYDKSMSPNMSISKSVRSSRRDLTDSYSFRERLIDSA